MTATRAVIVNADDFGQSPGINRGLIEAHERGIVTSASLMVRWPAAEAAAAYARAHPTLAVGLHLDLGEWVWRGGEWALLYTVSGDPDEQLVHQLERFRTLLGRDPTHIDSHQHAHRLEPTRSATLALAGELGVPARELTGAARYCGAFYGQGRNGEPNPRGISVEHLIELLVTLPAGTTELSCHPGLADDVDSMYRTERAHEVDALCNPRVRSALDAAGIELCSFADLGRGRLT